MKQLRITVAGKTYDVTVETLDDGQHAAPATRAPVAAAAPIAVPVAAPTPAAAPVAAGGADDVASPLSAKVVALNCKIGDQVAAGQDVITLEAMKMNTMVSTHKAGTVKAIHVAPGDTVDEGQPLLTLG